MRVNVYAEELTDRVEIVEKETADGKFTGVRFYLELPVTLQTPSVGAPEIKVGPETRQVKGPFIHREGDDDSAAVTFWGKDALRKALQKALELLDKYKEDKLRKGNVVGIPGRMPEVKPSRKKKDKELGKNLSKKTWSEKSIPAQEDSND